MLRNVGLSQNYFRMYLGGLGHYILFLSVK